MKRPSREEYQRAVALALAAIREEKAAPRIRADRSPEAVLARVLEKNAKGEALTEADLGAWAAALAEQQSRKQRGRGRPKGTRDHAAHAALRAAIWAVQESGLRPYRNNIGHRLSQCDAIAEAMKAEGFAQFRTYDGARREMMAHRKGMKGLRGALAGLARQWQAIARDISSALEPLARQMQEVGRAVGESLTPVQRQMQEAGRAAKALGWKAWRAILAAALTARSGWKPSGAGASRWNGWAANR